MSFICRLLFSATYLETNDFCCFDQQLLNYYHLSASVANSMDNNNIQHTSNYLFPANTDIVITVYLLLTTEIFSGVDSGVAPTSSPILLIPLSLQATEDTPKLVTLRMFSRNSPGFGVTASK